MEDQPQNLQTEPVPHDAATGQDQAAEQAQIPSFVYKGDYVTCPGGHRFPKEWLDPGYLARQREERTKRAAAIREVVLKIVHKLENSPLVERENEP